MAVFGRRRRPAPTRVRQLTSRGLLIAGYPVATWASARLHHAWRSGAKQPIMAFEAATVAVTAGWLLVGKRIAAALNGLAAAVLGVAWLSRRHRRR